jgi:putative ABC transport system ATP-binding protein
MDRRSCPSLSVTGHGQVALCGPSGSGKTTLLNILAGLQRPQRGTIRWSAIELTAINQRALDRWRYETVGLIFQEFHLFPTLSALENVLLPLNFARWSVPPTLKRRALDLLERVGVRAHGELRMLSRGEMQRVAMARALVLCPAIVLADEPTASLDRETGQLIADLLRTLCRESGATLIVATHDLVLADEFDASFEIIRCHLLPRAVRPTTADVMAFA